jgi:hypothetical protein
MVQNPLLKLDVDLRADFFRDTAKGTGIQLRGAVVSIEGIDVEFSYGETGCFAAARRATMTIRGRAKSAPEVSVCVLAHVFGELGLQEVATLIDDALANHLRAFRFGDLVARCEDLSGEGVKFRVILHVDRVERVTLDRSGREWFFRKHSQFNYIAV